MGAGDVRFTSSIDDKILRQFKRINAEIKASDRNLARMNRQVRNVDRSLTRARAKNIGGKPMAGMAGGGHGKGGFGRDFAGGALMPFGLMGGVGMMAGLVAGGALVAGIGGSISAFAKFERKMSEVRGLTQATELQFLSLSAEAKTLGRTTEFSANKVAEGMVFLAKAGLKTNQIMASLPAALNLALVGNIDMAQSADIATNIMTGMGIAAEDLGHVIDVMAKTTTSSNTDIIEMGEAMKWLAPQARMLKVPVTEVASVIGLLANSGLKGGIATRSLSTSLVRLANNPAASKMMKALKIEAFDKMTGEFVGFVQLIKNIERGMEGLTDQQRIYAMGQIVGNESVKSWNALMASGSEKLEKMTRLVDDLGFASRLAAIKTDNLKGEWIKFTSALEGAGIAIGERTGPMFRGLLEGATEFVNEFTDVMEMGTFKQQLKDLDKFTQKEVTGILTALNTLKRIEAKGEGRGERGETIVTNLARGMLLGPEGLEGKTTPEIEAEVLARVKILRAEGEIRKEQLVGIVGQRELKRRTGEQLKGRMAEVGFDPFIRTETRRKIAEDMLRPPGLAERFGVAGAPRGSEFRQIIEEAKAEGRLRPSLKIDSLIVNVNNPADSSEIVENLGKALEDLVIKE